MSYRRMVVLVGALLLTASAVLSAAIYRSWIDIQERNVTWRDAHVLQSASTAAEFVGLQKDVLRILQGLPSQDPRSMLFDDPDRGILLIRLNNLHSQYENLTNPTLDIFFNAIPAQRDTLKILGDFLAATEPEYERLKGNGNAAEVAAALLPRLEEFRTIEERFLALGTEIQTLTFVGREQAWREASSQALKVSIATFVSLLLVAFAGFALLLRFVRDRQTFEAQREAQLARAETQAERGRTQEILDELPIAVRVIDNRGEAIYANRALDERTWSELTPATAPLLQATTAPGHDRPVPASTGVPEVGQGSDVSSGGQAQHHLEPSAGSAKGSIPRTFIKSRNTYFEGGYKRLSDGSIVEAAYDVTDLVLAERSANASRQAAEEAGRAKATFLANMSHEIRTPMNGVIGLLELLGRTRLEPGQKETIGRINEAAYTLLTIIDDVLDFSKIEAGELLIEYVEVSIRDLAESVLELVGAKAEEKSIDLALFIDPALPDAVVVDPTRLRQIILNLLGNALKFTDRGAIVLRISAIDGAGGPDQIRIEVRDTGIGIDENQLSELFVPFRQAELSTARRYGGTGLGLSICQRLVTKMGGEIGAESRCGEGSTFWFLLPLIPAAANDLDAESHPDFSGNRVLVVSKSDLVAEMIGKLLSTCGAIVERAVSGAEALVLLERPGERPDILALDARVPIPDFGAWRPVVEKGRDLPRGDGIRFYGPLKSSRDKAKVECAARPVGRKQLWEAVGILLGKFSPEVDSGSELSEQAVAVEPPSIEEALKAGRLVLVAEDNKENRHLIRRQLTTLGYACEMAKDGREALEMWRRRRYGLIITDCNMPELDGFGLTAAVRAEEAGSHLQTPIVALTASALVGERERCLRSGMDAYLAKPVRLQALNDVVKAYLDRASADIRRTTDVDASFVIATASMSAQNGAPPIDHSLLKDLYGEERFEVIDSLIGSFKERYASLVTEMQEALEGRDGKAIAGEAHRAAGLVGAIGAVPMMHALQRLEKVANDGEWGRIPAEMAIVRDEWARLFDELNLRASECDVPPPISPEPG